MFSLQVGRLNRLAVPWTTQFYDREPDREWANEFLQAQEARDAEIIATFMETFGKCTDDLSHWGLVDFHNQVDFHDNVTFHQDVTFEGDIILPDDGTGDAKVLQWGKATAKWTNVAGTGKKSYVTCTKVDGDGNAIAGEGGGTITVYLPRTANRDPNVRTDDLITYAMDLAGDAVCTSDYLDDKIGTVKHWIGLIADIPPGWDLMDGTQGGSGKDARGRVPVCYREGDPDYGTIGGVGGTDFHNHPPHDGSLINPHIDYETGETELQTDTALVLIAVEPVTFDTLCALAGVNMPESYVPVTIGAGWCIPDHTHEGEEIKWDPASPNTINVVTPSDGTAPVDLCIPPGSTGWVHLGAIDLEEGLCTCAEHTQGHCHGLPFHSHSAYSPPHSHHIAPHLHSLPRMDHRGILPHEAADHRDKWITTCFIERID